MSRSDTIDLSENDPAVWRVLVNGNVYGPYTLGQMQHYVREGRIAAGSSVAEGDGGAFLPARAQPALTDSFAIQRQKANEAEAGPGKYLIVTRLNATTSNAMMGALNAMGDFAEVMAGVYVLRSASNPTAIRRRLASLTDISDKVLIMKAGSDRMSWLNLGPETDVHLKTVWDAA